MSGEEYLDCPTVGGEREEGWEGDGEESVDEEEILPAQLLRPFPRIVAHQLLHRELKGDLLGLVQELQGLAHRPRIKGGANQAVDVGQQRASEDGEGGESSEGEGVHALVEGSLHEHQGVSAEQSGDGGRVAALECLALASYHQPVEVGVSGEDGPLPKDVGGEDAAAVAPHSVVDEGLRILCLVSGDQPQGLPYQRNSLVPRGEKPLPLPLLSLWRIDRPYQKEEEESSGGSDEWRKIAKFGVGVWLMNRGIIIIIIIIQG